MGAANYTICPYCIDNSKKDIAKRKLELTNMYGKIPQSSYDEQKAKLDEEIANAEEDDDESLREEFSIEMDADGQLKIYYVGKCNSCGVKITYKHMLHTLVSDPEVQASPTFNIQR